MFLPKLQLLGLHWNFLWFSREFSSTDVFNFTMIASSLFEFVKFILSNKSILLCSEKAHWPKHLKFVDNSNSNRNSKDY